MSIIDNLLVVLDDNIERDINEIKLILPNYSKQVLAASLGRIVSKKFVNKTTKNTYQISPHGQDIITENLKNIEKKEQNILYTNCYFVLLNIPEKERINRDVMRTYMNLNGFGRLHNTVWIGLNINNNKLRKLIKNLDIQKNVIIFKAELDQLSLNDLIKRTQWNLDKIIKEYKNLNSEIEKYLLLKKKSKYIARCLVYEYAKICQQDPMLPNDLLPKQYLALKSHDLYKQIREHCS